MFFKVICLYLASVCVFAAPPTDVVPLEKLQPTIPIIAQSEELEANGTFKFSYETANGIKREETSYDKVLPNARSGASTAENGEDKSYESNEIHVQQGSYSYTAPEGSVISVRYIADENGFRPIGDHLPKPPSIIIAASSTRISGPKAKSADNAEESSAPVAVIAAATTQEAPAPNEAPKIKSRIAEPSSAEQALSPKSESQDSITTPEAPSTTQGNSTVEPISTTESALTTTESASTTTESSSTTSESALTSTESASTTTDQFTTTEVASTEQPSTTEVAPTLKPASIPSNSSSIAESTPSSEAMTETGTIVSA